MRAAVGLLIFILPSVAVILDVSLRTDERSGMWQWSWRVDIKNIGTWKILESLYYLAS